MNLQASRIVLGETAHLLELFKRSSLWSPDDRAEVNNSSCALVVKRALETVFLLCASLDALCCCLAPVSLSAKSFLG
jgi:hypothetical protein